MNKHRMKYIQIKQEALVASLALKKISNGTANNHQLKYLEDLGRDFLTGTDSHALPNQGSLLLSVAWPETFNYHSSSLRNYLGTVLSSPGNIRKLEARELSQSFRRLYGIACTIAARGIESENFLIRRLFNN